MRRPKNILLFLIGLAILSSGCDQETIISPFSGRDAYFSIYGYLSSNGSQFVRVSPIRNDLDRDKTPVSLDVEVTTRAIGSGRTQTWSQVLPRLEDGQAGLMFSDSTFGHVFTSSFVPVVGETYEIEVVRPDGATTRARTKIPFVNKPVLGPYRTVGDTVYHTVLWPGLTKAPAEIQSVYRLDSPIFKPEIQIPAAPVTHNGEGYLTADGWEIEINLNEDVSIVRQFVNDNLDILSDLPSLEDPLNFPLQLVDVRMRATVRDSSWTFVADEADLARLSQPGAVSNVENGFGYFGSLGTEVDTWLLTDPIILQLIGFN